MKKLMLITLVVITSGNYCLSQNSISNSTKQSTILSLDDLETKYLDYFELANETIFTQLNKSTYFKDEHLWFKSYIYNTKTQKPYISTTNVYASIYNEEGKLLIKKLYYADYGFTNGDFRLDSTLTTGTYYLKLDTNWMKNFNENSSNIQKFEIVKKPKVKSLKKDSQISYDFQLLPEGGHLVNNTINNVGFKILNSRGKSIVIDSGKVFDTKKNLITTFKSNEFGIGKFQVELKKGENHFCKIILGDGKVIEKPLPKPSEIGISIILNSTLNSGFEFIYRTNKETLKLINGKPYHLLIHRDGMAKKIKVEFANNKLNYVIKLPKKELFPGINIFTLFNDLNKPIAERMVFNDFKTPLKSIIISKIIKGIDSTTIELSTNIDASKEKSLSISVLPSSTTVYNDNSTIASTFLLSPYIKGNIENPRYYFNNENSKKTSVDLDLLLLTQGWSKFSWNNIFNNPPKLKYNFEIGFSIIGSLDKYRHHKGNRLLLSSKENLFKTYSKIANKNNFSYKNLFIAEKTNMNFKIENRYNTFRKTYVSYEIQPKYVVDSINFKNINLNNKFQPQEKSHELSSTNFDMILPNSITKLEVVKLKNIKNKVKPKNNPIGLTFGAKHINSSNVNDPNSLVIDQIRYNGFRVVSFSFNLKIETRKQLSLNDSLAPKVFLDNMELEDLNIISNLRLSDIDEMYISRRASAVHSSAAGVIHIFSKHGKSQNNQYLSAKSKIDFGFSAPQEYYSPKYNTSNYDIFSKYGLIHWEPNLINGVNGELSFKIPNYSYQNFNLYIEGMAEDGSLFSKMETIKI